MFLLKLLTKTYNVNRNILQLQVLGQNLAAVCKLIFKVSRSDQNDQLFLEDNILGEKILTNI
jgi:hypothetical protein